MGSAERLIVVMTTNHAEKLDPALIRPGRADRRFEIGYATADEARRLFLTMLPDFASLADRFAETLTNPRATIADLQGVLLQHRHDPSRLFDDPACLAALEGDDDAGVASCSFEAAVARTG